MSARAARLVQQIEQLAASSDSASDAELLERFIHLRDEAAFAGIVGRYGPMVLLVCRRLLADAHAAEDCLQATFLVLARKAASIRRQESLAAFLHSIACRVARKARAASYRSRAIEVLDGDVGLVDPRPDPLSELTARELMTALDEEVGRLPADYRLPVVLCCLEGLSLDETARRLGWTVGSVKGRLERGRKRLHARLTRRGLTLSVVLAAAEVSRGFALAPALLESATLRSALEFAAGRAAGGVSARVTALAEGACQAGRMLRRTTIAAVLLSVGVTAGAGILMQRRPANPVEIRQNGASGSFAQAAEKPREERGPAKEDPGEPLPPGAVARMGSVRFCSGTTVQSVAFSPDRKTLASGNAYGTVSLWDIATGKEIRLFQAWQNPMVSVLFAPDGKLLAARGEDGDIRLWEPSTGKQVRHIVAPPAKLPPGGWTAPSSWAFRIAFSPNGKTLAAAAGDLAGLDSEIRLWNVESGKERLRFRGHKGAVRTFAFAPDGKTFASGGADKTVRLWDPETGKQLHLLRGAGDEVVALAWSADGKALVSGGDDRMIRLWSPAGTELRKWTMSAMVKSVVFIDEHKLAWGDEKGIIHLVDLKTEKELRRLERHAYGVSDLCRSPDGKTLASLGSGLDHTIHLWQVDTGKKLSPQPDAHQGRVGSVVFSPDGKTLVSGGWEATIRLWDPATGKEQRRLEGAGLPMALSPDGKTLVVAGQDNLRFLDPASGRELRRSEYVGSGNTISVAFAPDGKTVVMGKNRFDGQWRGFFLHDAATGKELRPFVGHSYNVNSVAFSPDGKTVASGAEDNTARLWETATGKERFRLSHRHWVQTVAFSSDGEMLVSADARSIHLWNPATGKELRAIDVEHGASCAVFSPDGKTLASGEYDPIVRGPVVRLREVATGKEICRWIGHRQTVSSLAFRPDGRTLASGSWDTLILVWDVTGLSKGSTVPRLARGELEDLWDHLGADDVPRAYRAVWQLAAASEQAVPFLAGRLHPAPKADARRLARLIRDLDSDQFAVRESATTELETLGETARLVLSKAPDSKPSLEVRTRIERLLKKLQSEANSQERLRFSRALQTVEHSGTAAARRLLKHLAGGGADAWQSREAMAALERLERR